MNEPNGKSSLSIRQRIGPAIIRRLRYLGIRLKPFLMVQEARPDGGSFPAESPFRFAFIDDPEDLASSGVEPSLTPEKVQYWIDSGKRCFGAWSDEGLVASMWCDFDEINFEPAARTLKPDEVYLFAAYADPAYRGQGLAPAMRAACYDALRKFGRQRFYSYSDYYNLAARRFKTKLGARDRSLHLHVELFDWYSHTFTLREYL